MWLLEGRRVAVQQRADTRASREVSPEPTSYAWVVKTGTVKDNGRRKESATNDSMCVTIDCK